MTPRELIRILQAEAQSLGTDTEFLGHTGMASPPSKPGGDPFVLDFVLYRTTREEPGFRQVQIRLATVVGGRVTASTIVDVDTVVDGTVEEEM